MPAPGSGTHKVLDDVFAHFTAQRLIVKKDRSYCLSLKNLKMVNTHTHGKLMFYRHCHCADA